jgi:glycosyltransferase involved in cell wall biosynthesis
LTLRCHENVCQNLDPRDEGSESGWHLRLVVFHYHLRPGGIRRVIEHALPWLVREASNPVDEVVLATGEADDPGWNQQLCERLRPVPVRFEVNPAWGYLAEQKHRVGWIRKRVRAGLARLFPEGGEAETMVWAHNLGIARNVVLTDELLSECADRGIRVLAHHHDWWFDNRWQRWSDVRRAGIRSLTQVARATFRGGRKIRHAAINSLDAGILRRHLGAAAGWLPNLSGSLQRPKRQELRSARCWVEEQLGARGAPVWILPCRLLRRKNVAEAWLLTRWLRPEAWLVVTGSASSREEEFYARRLDGAARAGKWRLRVGLLEGETTGQPGVPELLEVSEAVLLTSIQEGFGLPYLEAAAAGRPLLARSLPNIGPDLRRFGFRFPHAYEEIRIDPGMFDWDAEVKRQQRLYGAWRRRLPVGCRGHAGEPRLLAEQRRPGPIPLSRLTLTAQLEVLAQPPEVSWDACLRFNPFLLEWRGLAARGGLQRMAWPEGADRWLGGEAYARRLHRLWRSRAGQVTTDRRCERLQADFLRIKLATEQLYPLLWALDT